MRNLLRSRPRRIGAVLLAVAASLTAVLGAQAASSPPKGVTGYFGSTGAYGGQFSETTGVAGVAVNDASGDVYAVDRGNQRVEEFSSSGAFIRAWGENVVAAGAPNRSDATQALSVSATGGSFTLSFGGQASAAINYDATAAEVQSALSALSSIGAGNVTVSGGPGNAAASTPYIITFVGRLKEAAQPLLTTGATALSGGSQSATVATTDPGATGFDICDTTAAEPDTAAQCQKGSEVASEDGLGGAMHTPEGLAVNQSSGNVYVTDGQNRRVDEFSADGAFIRAWGQGVVASGPDRVTATSAVQSLTVSAEGGAFTLGFQGVTTTELPYDATAAEVQAALRALSSIGAGNVTVSGGPGNAAASTPYLITFAGTLADAPMAQITADATALTGAVASATVATTTEGATGFDVCNAASGDVCQAGTSASTAGAFLTVLTGYPAVAPAGAPNAGDVLVGDPYNRRVQEFTEDGAFVRAFGYEVVAAGPDDNGTGFDICTAASFDVCQQGSNGAGVGQFAAAQPTRVAEDSSGDIYTVEKTVNFRTQKFTPQAASPPSTQALSPAVLAQASGTSATNTPTDLAFEPANGNILVTSAFAAGATASCPITGTASVAERRVLELEPSGTLVATHMACAGIDDAEGLAVNPTSGDVYVSSTTPEQRVYVLNAGAPAAPSARITGVSASAEDSETVSGTVDPNGPDLPYGIDTTYQFEYKPASAATYTALPSTPASAGDAGTNVAVSEQLSGLQAGSEYDVRLTATKPYGSGTATTAITTFTTPAAGPGVLAIPASSVAATSATLRGQVNPNNSATSYHFEYGTTEAYGHSTPEASAGSAGTPGFVAEEISGLQADTTYYFRLVAANANDTDASTTTTFTTDTVPSQSQSCPNEALRVESNSGELPGCRAFEKMTPDYKGGIGATEVPFIARDGEHVIVESQGSWGGGEEAAAHDNKDQGSYELSRTASGWQTTWLDPPAAQFPADALLATSPELQSTLWQVRTPTQSADNADFLLRDAQGTFTDIGPLLPPTDPSLSPPATAPGATGIRATFLGASEDLSYVLFEVKHPAGTDQLDENWPGDTTTTEGASLWEYIGTGSSEPIAVDVNDADQMLTDCGTEVLPGEYNEISASGRTIFFVAIGHSTTTCPSSDSAPPVDEVYARIDNGEAGAQTVDISEPSSAECSACDTTAPAAANAVGASEDGSKIFFETTQQLLPADTDATNDLYMFDFDRPAGQRVVQVSAGGTGDPSPGSGAEVQGYVTSSEDGSHVYFVANGILTTTPNGVGESATQGADNMYVYDTETATTAFVATLSASDSALWENTGEPKQADTTPDGDFLVFASVADLTPDNTSTVAQIFRYDAQTGVLLRISTGQDGYDGDGNTTTNAATLTAWPINNREGSQGLADILAGTPISENGSYIVFDTVQALAPNDQDGVTNAYLWHEGQTSLIGNGAPGSTGDTSETASPSQAELSPSGEDVFIATKDELIPADQDQLPDIYDARVDGGFPAPVTPQVCRGEECQGPLTAPLTPLLSGSSASPAIGNLTPVAEQPPVVQQPVVPSEEAKLKIVKHSVKGDTATILASVSSAGKVVAAGSDLTTVTKSPAKAKEVTLKLKLTKKGSAALAKHPHRALRIKVKLVFTPKSGAKVSKTVTVSFPRLRVTGKHSPVKGKLASV